MYILTSQLQGICRHPGISHTLPCSTVLLRFCQMPAPTAAAPASSPRSLGIRALRGVGSGWEGGAPFAAQTSPSPSRKPCCWRLLQGCRPARLLLKGRRSPRHQLCTPFLLFFLSVLAPFPPEVQARLRGAPSRFPWAQRGRWSALCAAGGDSLAVSASSSLRWPGRRLKKKKKIK